MGLSSARAASVPLRFLSAAPTAVADGIDWLATSIAKGPKPLALRHLHVRRREAHSKERHVFLLDCSASMVANGGLALAKALLTPWLRQLRRESTEAVLYCFGGGRVDRRFGPAIPSGWNERWIAPIGGGGGTPLTLGLTTVQRAVPAARDRPHRLFLLTDGRTTEQPIRPAGFETITVIDFNDRPLAAGRCALLAQRWSAHCIPASTMATR